MLKRFITAGVFVCTAMLVWAQPAHAQQQTVNFSLGYFTPFGADARSSGDVLIANRSFLLFDPDGFNGASVGGEWLFPLGRVLEGGIGMSFSRKTVPSVYQDFVDSDGTEIDQELRLREVPFAFTVRLLPLGGTGGGFQPYIGGGLGVVAWRYSESGEFIDFNAGNEIFLDSFVATGADVGPVVLGGLRLQGHSASGGFEIRYQKAEGTLDNRF